MYERTKIRKYKRMETPYMARFRVKQYEDQAMSSPDWDIVAVENLSAGGVLFNYNKNLERDSLLDLKIDISKTTPTINCVGKIIRIEEFQYLLTQEVQPLNSMFLIATEFTEIDKQERDMINITVEETLRKEAKGRNFNLEKPRPRAIVLEDGYLLRTLIDGVLKDRGYEVHGSSEPFFSPIFLESKCSCSIGTHCTNIIITDINMSNMTGLEFVEHQKRNGCKIQNVAMMSWGWTGEEVEHAKRLGCHIFEKPFKFDEIEKWLDDCEKKLDPDNKLSDLPIRMINQRKINEG